MAQYAVHKIGFYYTDECLAVGEEKGTILNITRSKEEAQEIKKKEDIVSMKKTSGYHFADFLFDHPNESAITKQVTEYLKSEFNIEYITEYPCSPIPDNLTNEQAARFLQILELQFHNIVEYEDDEIIDPSIFEFDPEKTDYSGF